APQKLAEALCPNPSCLQSRSIFCLTICLSRFFRALFAVLLRRSLVISATVVSNSICARSSLIRTISSSTPFAPPAQHPTTKLTKDTKMEFDQLSRTVIGCAIEVHRQLGPGLLESTYRQCLACELSHAAIPFQMEMPLPVRYKDVLLDCGYRIDLIVSGDLIVEIKSVETL